MHKTPYYFSLSIPFSPFPWTKGKEKLALSLVLPFLIYLLVPPANAQEENTTKRELPAIYLNPPPVIDGDLSDLCWQEAAKADRFTDALYGNLVQDQTIAYLGYDEKYIYVAFYAYDSQPQGIIARETKRGSRPRGEDIVAFSIDCFHTHKFRDRSFFIVNPLGTQFAQLAGGRGTKLEWEGAWKASAKIVKDGWTAEMAIPWAILNYPLVKSPTTCGINFDRFHQRTKIHSWWSNVGPQEFLELDGHWVGIQFPPFRPQLSLLPFLIPGWQKKGGLGWRSGMDLRATLTPSLTLVGTINPDFENVEGSVEGIDFSYSERFVPDRRPFFLEGTNIYQSGSIAGRYFHSRRIPSFDLGLNLYGKVTQRDTLGFLAALDWGRRLDWVARARHEMGPTSSVDLAFINRDDQQHSNRVLVLGENFRKSFLGLDASWAGSWVNGRFTGDIAHLFLSYQTPRLFFGLTPHYVRPGFKDDLGFIPFTDFKGLNGFIGYGNEWRKGTLRSCFIDASFFNSKHYNGQVFRRQKSLFAYLETRSDYGISFGWEGGRFEQFEDSLLSFSLRTRVSDPFHNFGIGYSWGKQAGAPITFITPSATWRFGQSLTLGLSSQILHHKEDRQQHIFTFNYDFSPRRGMGGRIVAQTGGTNFYLAYRQSGYGGVEQFLILGDPNARKFTRRLVVKVIWPM